MIKITASTKLLQTRPGLNIYMVRLLLQYHNKLPHQISQQTIHAPDKTRAEHMAYSQLLDCWLGNPSSTKIQ